MFQLFGPSRGLGSSLTAVPMTRLGVLVAIVIAGGCAAAETPPSRVAGPPPEGIKVEIEDDGLPSQIALKNRRPVADDPSEPWSPNYGSPRTAPAVTSPQAAPIMSQAADASVPRPVLASASSSPALHPDDIIRQAVAEHEMRRR